MIQLLDFRESKGIRRNVTLSLVWSCDYNCSRDLCMVLFYNLFLSLAPLRAESEKTSRCTEFSDSFGSVRHTVPLIWAYLIPSHTFPPPVLGLLQIRPPGYWIFLNMRTVI